MITIETFVIIVLAATIIEAICETLKMIWQNGKLNKDRVIALIVALVVCAGSGVDLLGLLGIVFKIPYLGVILTAILVSRGASFIHDFINLVSGYKQLDNTATRQVESAAAKVTITPDGTFTADAIKTGTLANFKEDPPTFGE